MNRGFWHPRYQIWETKNGFQLRNDGQEELPQDIYDLAE